MVPSQLMAFDPSTRFWEGWRERRLGIVPRVLPRVTKKVQERIGQGLEMSRKLQGQLLQITTQIRQILEEAVRLKKEGQRARLRGLRERLH